MERFAGAGITMNCQVVACPGINDGPALARTMEDLAALWPAVNSVAVVPVGVTKFREGLYPHRALYPGGGRRRAGPGGGLRRPASLAEQGTRLVWCSDEFYLLAGRPLPEKAYYEEYGPAGKRRGDAPPAHRARPPWPWTDAEGTETPTPFSIATGVSAAPFLQEIVDMARKKCGNIRGTVYPIVNRFFGETITVSGLVTGRDLIEQLRGRELGERLLIPANMLRAGERVFLDDVTVEQVEQALGVPVIAGGRRERLRPGGRHPGPGAAEAPGCALPPEDGILPL